MLDDFDPPADFVGILYGPKLPTPLHYATKAQSDSECVDFYKKYATNNVLHVASSLVKPLSVRWLMENVDPSHNLSSSGNTYGYTPLESLQNELESHRTQQNYMFGTIDMSDHFAGFIPEAVDCLMMLHDTHDTIPNNNTNLSRAQLRYGCICGECLGGFISPRMKALLTSQASSFSTR